MLNSLIISLLAGNLRVETSSLATASATTHSLLTRDFPDSRKSPAFCGAVRGRFVSTWRASRCGRALRTRNLWPRISFSWETETGSLETGSTERGVQRSRPNVWCWRDHSAGMSQRRVASTPRGRRPSRAALTRAGDRNASEIVMLTLRGLQSSRRAIVSAVAFESLMSSSSQQRPRAIAAIKVARVGAMFHNAAFLAAGVPVFDISELEIAEAGRAAED